MTPEKLSDATKAFNSFKTAERTLDRVEQAKSSMYRPGDPVKISLYVDGVYVCEMLPLELCILRRRLAKNCDVKRQNFEDL